MLRLIMNYDNMHHTNRKIHFHNFEQFRFICFLLLLNDFLFEKITFYIQMDLAVKQYNTIQNLVTATIQLNRDIITV